MQVHGSEMQEKRPLLQILTGITSVMMDSDECQEMLKRKGRFRLRVSYYTSVLVFYLLVARGALR